MAIQETQLEDASKIPFGNIWGNNAFDHVGINASGRSGGLACVWNPLLFSKVAIYSESRFIWIQGKLKGSQDILNVVNIYGPHDPTQKRSLWQRLLNLKLANPGLWIMMGDFNTVRYPHEPINSEFCKYTASDFNSFINDGQLLEYRMGGRKFTYFSSAGAKLSKIDRIMVSHEFQSSWPYASLIALPREKSDHSPVILKTMNNGLVLFPSGFLIHGCSGRGQMR